MRPCGVFDKTYEKDMAIVRTWQHWTLLVSAIALAFLAPLIVPERILTLLNDILITVIVVLGLQVVTGYCGQISFGQPAFMAVGAFTSAVLTSRFAFSFWPTIPLSGIAAGIVGLIGGLPSLKIKGFYLAMSTIAILFLTIFLITHLNITGGMNGLFPPPPRIGNFAFDTDGRMYYVILIITLLLTFFTRNLVRSRVGRAFVAIRDNDIAASLMGINIFYYKMSAFFISCFYAGVGGSLLAHWYQVANAEQFTLLNAIIYVGMIIVGGLGSIPGVFFGVIFLKLLDELVLFVSPKLSDIFPWIGMGLSAALGVMTFGLVLIVFLIYEPRGLAHRWEIFKTSCRIYPFRN